MPVKGLLGVDYTHLLCAKSKIAPLSKITIARLELCVANIVAKLHQSFEQSLKLTIGRTYSWTDSTIVLAGTSNPSGQWNTFVANRVMHGPMSLTEDQDKWFVESFITPSEVPDNERSISLPLVYEDLQVNKKIPMEIKVGNCLHAALQA